MGNLWFKSNGKINPRVILWLIILVTIATVYYMPTGQVKNKTPQQKPAVDKQLIRTDFLDLKGKPVPVKPVLGGRFQAEEILFPRDFKGEPGSVFYVEMEDGHIAATIKYKIERINTGPPLKVEYKVLQSYEPGQIDPRQFDAVPVGNQQIRNANPDSNKP
ncbi:MAG: hypothetical protein ACM3UZ_05765 [Acidobacteriota bacterium]